MSEFVDQDEVEARHLLISAALSYAASDTYFQVTPGNPDEDAEMDLKLQMLDKAVKDYVTFLSDYDNTKPDENPDRPEVSES